ncbi:serine/threonine protein kinase [Stappia sp. GBMRC 2046]|uniref:Serine/threonine protein kinase n=1 Tax=Stappia sediminis TaxID=2692190 RepID=A0A7X3S9H9_9HYPH|nr:serine/threonine protein kinase [Stappia sediminis]MXN66869.1 serine/threonine protein kinase [Stappia sediminis]
MTLETIHATCVVIGSAGVLIRGSSGSGKSNLGEELVDRATARGRFAAFVSDDYCLGEAANGRLVVRPPEPLAGLWERRGEGIVRVCHEPAAIARLLVDLAPVGDIDRLPEAGIASERILGVALPVIRLPEGRESLDARRVLRWVFEGPPQLVEG